MEKNVGECEEKRKRKCELPGGWEESSALVLLGLM